MIVTRMQLYCPTGAFEGEETVAVETAVAAVSKTDASLSQINIRIKDLEFLLNKYRKEVIRQNRETRDGKRADNISQSISNR